MKNIIAYKLSCLKQETIPSSRTQILKNTRKPRRNLLSQDISQDYNESTFISHNYSTINPSDNKSIHKGQIQDNKQMMVWDFFNRFDKDYEVVRKKVEIQNRPINRNLHLEFIKLQTKNSYNSQTIKGQNCKEQILSSRIGYHINNIIFNKQQILNSSKQNYRDHNNRYESCVRQYMTKKYSSKQQNRAYRSISLKPNKIGISLY